MDRSSAIDTVIRVGWLSRQSKNLQDMLLSAAHLRHYVKGEVIYGLGDDSGGLFGLVSGQLDVIISPMSLPPTFVHVAQPGWWVGEAALITNTTRRAGLRARSSSWMFHIDKSSIERLAAGDPRLWRSLAEITVSHLDHALALLATLSQKDPSTRVLAALTHIASMSGLEEDITVSLTHEELGEMTRLSRHAVRKILHGFQKERLVQMRYGKLILADTNRLREKLIRLGG